MSVDVKKGFWTVLEDCVGQRIEGSPEVRVIPLDTIEFYFKSHPGWGGPLLGSWVDEVLDERLRPPIAARS
jgi:hypothetical protein